MKANEFITEGTNVPVTVVDVQPGYTFNGTWGEFPDYEDYDEDTGEPIGEPFRDGESADFVAPLMQFLNKQQAPILALIVGEDSGMTDDTLASVQEYWKEHGFTNWSRVTWYDKGYGYLRGPMDRGVDDASVIKVIRAMYQQKVTDARELFGGGFDDVIAGLVDLIGDEEHAEIIAQEGLSVEWLSISLLKKHAGYIVGGGKDECLREVELLMSAFNIKHKQIQEFIY